jgi:nitronate monooxygenase
VLDKLRVPIVQAPMAGGPSTPALAAAVSESGGLGFVAAGYKSADAMAADIEETRAHTERPFGVNVFMPPNGPADPSLVATYVERLRDAARQAGAELGAPRFDDDDFHAKLERLVEQPAPVVSLPSVAPRPRSFKSCAPWAHRSGSP